MNYIVFPASIIESFCHQFNHFQPNEFDGSDHCPRLCSNIAGHFNDASADHRHFRSNPSPLYLNEWITFCRSISRSTKYNSKYSMWADKGRKDANGFIVLMFVLIIWNIWVIPKEIYSKKDWINLWMLVALIKYLKYFQHYFLFAECECHHFYCCPQRIRSSFRGGWQNGNSQRIY